MAGRMSDISITFPWYSWPLIAALFGWPGLLIGLLLGGLLWRRHRISGAVLSGIAGCLLWFAGWIWLSP
jgi:Na+/proline symporter